MQRRGALYVAHSAEELPQQASLKGSMQVTVEPDSKYAPVVYWAVLAPTQACAAAPAR